MFFILLTFGSALFIETLGSIISVIGITKLFGYSYLIIALAIALDIGKIITVSLLYSYWQQLSRLMKAYALCAATITMVITSAGASGYLAGAFQQAIVSTKEGELQVKVLKEQQAKYQLRKQQIDDQIANLPTRTTVNQRLRLMRGFKAEQEALNAKLAEIDKQLPELQLKQLGTETKAGPILYIAQAFDITVEQAVKFVILMIIFVFDPLAIFLIIAGNFLWAQRKAEKKAEQIKHFKPPAEPSITQKHQHEQSIERALEPQYEEPLKQSKPFKEPDLPTTPPVTNFQDLEPEATAPHVTPSTSTYDAGGLLKPVQIDLPEVPPQPPPVISSLVSVHPDPHTLVDAYHVPGFKQSTITAPPKK